MSEETELRNFNLAADALAERFEALTIAADRLNQRIAASAASVEKSNSQLDRRISAGVQIEFNAVPLKLADEARTATKVASAEYEKLRALLHKVTETVSLWTLVYALVGALAGTLFGLMVFDIFLAGK